MQFEGHLDVHNLVHDMTQTLTVGVLTPQQFLILCAICNRGGRLVKTFFVYFNVRKTKFFSKTKFMNFIQELKQKSS